MGPENRRDVKPLDLDQRSVSVCAFSNQYGFSKLDKFLFIPFPFHSEGEKRLKVSGIFQNASFVFFQNATTAHTHHSCW